MKQIKPCAIIYVSAVQAIEILDIEHGIEDYVVYRWLNGTSTENVRRARIRHNMYSGQYFNSDGRRWKLEDAMRIN